MLAAIERNQRIAPDPIRRLAALLPPSGPVADAVAARLRLSKKQRDRLSCVAERQASDAGSPRALAYREGPACAIDRLLLVGADTGLLKGWTVPELPLKGGEIVARGVKAGPEVARILRKVEAYWVAEGFPNRDRVLVLLDAVLSD